MISMEEKFIVASYSCVQFDTYARWLPDDSLLLGSRISSAIHRNTSFLVWRRGEGGEVDGMYERGGGGARGEGKEGEVGRVYERERGSEEKDGELTIYTASHVVA